MLYRSAPSERRFFETDLAVRPVNGGDWLRLSPTARAVWERIEYPTGFVAIVDGLTAEFDAPAQTIEAGVRRTLDVFDANGLLEQHRSTTATAVQRQRYLSLLKRALTNLLHVEQDLRLKFLIGELSPESTKFRFLRDIRTRQPEAFDELVRAKLCGRQAPLFAHTMSGMFRLDNIERCAEQIFADGIAGDFLEAGVCRGGATMLMRALQLAHGQEHRNVWLADSFRGVPPSDDGRDLPYGLNLEEARQPGLACDLESVREHFRSFDLLSPQVRFLPGWLHETLPDAAIGDLALLRLDVDLYSSTEIALECLYDRVVVGGYVIIDDYGCLTCCRDAVDAFRARRGIDEPLLAVDWTGVFWRKAAHRPDIGG